MARRGRFRKAGPRAPSGRASRAKRFAAEPMSLFAVAQRLAAVDPETSEQILLIGCRPEAAWSGRERDIVLCSTSRARNPNLTYLPGIAFERGLLAFTDAAGEAHDGHELLQAGDIYVGLHRQVWGRLTEDIERALTSRYGPDAFDLLLEVGRVSAPAPPSSHFRQLVAGTPVPLSAADPDERERRRLRLADRYGEARAVLTRVSLTALLIVENVVIEGIEPSFLRAGQVRTANSIEAQEAFVAGLRALAEHFGLFDKRANDRRKDRRTEAARVRIDVV